MFALPRLLTVASLAAAALVGVPVAASAAEPPIAPIISEVRTATASAVISWRSTPRTSYYRVCLRRSVNADTCETTSPMLKTTTKSFGGLTAQAGTDYVATVIATNAYGKTSSAPAKVDLKTSSAPAKPQAPTITEVRTASVSAVITWTPTDRTSYYRVCLRRSATATTCDKTSAMLKTTTTSFSGLSAQSGSDYVLTVRAHNAHGSTESATREVELKQAPGPTAPAAPTGLSERIGYNSAVISWSPAKNADSYDVCLRRGTSTTCSITTARTTSTSATMGRLTPASGVDYRYVVRAHRGTATSTSAPQDLTLLVGAVSALTLRATAPTSLTTSWSAVANADSYQVEIARSEDMKTYPRTYTTSDTSFTRTDATAGRRYYARVRAVNATRTGSVSPVGTRLQPTAPATPRVVTYNLCGQDKCRSSRNASTVPSWSKRKASAGSTVRATGAGIVSTQESGDKDTNFITQLPGFKRAAYMSAKSLFYDTDEYRLLRSGSLTLDSQRRRYAVWAELEDIATNTPFIVVDPHLEPYKGRTNDVLRETQTNRMLSLVDALNTRDLPVVYAGDVNSNKDNADQSKYKGGFDGVLKAFKARGHVNTLDLAKSRGDAHNSLYNSANQGIRTPIKNGDHVDAIYTGVGVGVAKWQVVIDILNPTQYRTPFPSDHNPLLADLVIPGLKEKP